MNNNKLISKTVIYAIGNFGTKILAYVMVLVYSYYLKPKDLGYYDIVLSTISMLQPLIMLQINDGTFRFLVDSKNKKLIISNSVKFLLISLFVSEFLYFVFCSYFSVDYAVLIGVLFFSSMVYTLLHDVIRGLDKSKDYATYGIINSILVLFFEIIGLTLLKVGISALIISKIISNLFCVLLILIREKDVRHFYKNKFDYHGFKPVLQYSIPLVPNTICWWVVNSSDRYIILFCLGAAYNGIYSIANKFPTVLTTITGIFFLAWQETALSVYNMPNRDEYFTSIFKKYYTLLFTLCLCAIPLTKIVIIKLISPDYISSWEYTGFLYLGAVFSALCSFLGMGYQISKETHRSVFSTILASFLNIAINLSLIKVIGLQAASLSTFLSYLLLMVIRFFDSKKYFYISMNWLHFFTLFSATLVFIAIIFVFKNLLICYVLFAISLVLLISMNKSIFTPYLNKLIFKSNKT